MVLLTVMITMALFSSLPSSIIVLGLFLAWLADAQTQTVYLTQTVFTACDCASSPTSSLRPSVIPPLSILTATPTMPDTELPPAVVSILGGSTPGIPAPLSVTSTLVGTFPPLSALSAPVPVSFSSSVLPSSWPEPMDSLPNTPLVTTTTVTMTQFPTTPSPISLSNGLGTLLSSSTTSMSPSSPAVVSVSPGTGTTIQPVFSTMEATAPSSALTTEGIPPALSVNPSLVSSDVSLASSAALISFGTTSPAVFSTVLPSGLSLATSSQVLTTYPAIPLNSVSLTGVTILAPRSPTSCFALPTPLNSMDLVAVAVTPQDDYDLSDPMLFAFGENATNPQYIGALSSGDPYILDLSPDNPITGQLGLQLPGENALVFDGSGISLFAGNCTSLSQVLIDNFYSQLGAMSGLVSRPIIPGKLAKRQGLLNTTDFTVVVSVDSYLKTPYFSPNLTFGNSLCTLQTNTMGASINNITWSCLYPPPQGGAAACAARLDTWLGGLSVPSIAPRNTTQVLATLSPFLSLAGDSLLKLFPGSDPALSLAFAFMRQVEAAAKEAVGDVGSAACNVMHGFDSDSLVIEDSGPLGTKTLGSFVRAPPLSLEVNLAASATASIVSLPRRKANPKDNFLLQIATDFASILGPFVTWLHHLPLLGIFGMEETGMVHLPTAALTHPMTTTISTTTLASAQSIVHIKVPTVTVTHVLGEGWFSPSTYVVGPGTSTIPQFPALATYRPATDRMSTYINQVSPTDSPTSSAADSMSLNVVQNVATQLAAMYGDPGVRTGWHWDWPNPPSAQGEVTTTTGSALGYDGHVVLVTTTVTDWVRST